MPGVFLLVNPARTRRRGVDDAIRNHLDGLAYTVTDIRPCGIDDIAPAVTRALATRSEAADGPDRLLIAGGDGLIHHALPALAGTDVEVGIVGVGTGNDFARALDLPGKVKAAVDAALGPTTPVDLIAAHHLTAPRPTADPPTTDDTAGAGEGAPTYAASVVTGGFSGTVNARANGLRFPPGQQRYTVATLLELPRLEAVELHLTVDGEEHELASAMFAVANTRYFGGGMAVCPDADPTDGLLDVTVVGPVGPVTLARVLPTVFSGRHVKHPQVTTYRGAEVRIATDSDLWADGERFGGQTFTAVRGALHVATSL